jgi:hypothetical protein
VSRERDENFCELSNDNPRSHGHCVSHRRGVEHANRVELRHFGRRGRFRGQDLEEAVRSDLLLVLVTPPPTGPSVALPLALLGAAHSVPLSGARIYIEPPPADPARTSPFGHRTPRNESPGRAHESNGGGQFS